jgi:hypothetical protein
MKMEQTECSETSAYKIQTPGNAFFTKSYEVSYLGFLQIVITGIGTGTSTVQLEQMGGNRDQVGEAVRTVH